MPTAERFDMARTRALLTETERRHIAGEGTDQQKYEAVSRARARIRDELTKDAKLLEHHHRELLKELRAVVCAETIYYCPRCGEGFPRINEAINHATLTIDDQHQDIDTEKLAKLMPEWWLDDLPDDWRESRKDDEE